MFCCRRRHPIKTPQSPSLTPDEIQKIKDNLSNVTDFNFYEFINQFITKNSFDQIYL
jgi:hypothetical protein